MHGPAYHHFAGEVAKIVYGCTYMTHTACTNEKHEYSMKQSLIAQAKLFFSKGPRLMNESSGNIPDIWWWIVQQEGFPCPSHYFFHQNCPGASSCPWNPPHLRPQILTLLTQLSICTTYNKSSMLEGKVPIKWPTRLLQHYPQMRGSNSCAVPHPRKMLLVLSPINSIKE